MSLIKEVNGIKYFITNPNDVIQNTICNNLQWNNNIVSLIKKLIFEYKLKHFLNVGAHIGTVALPISKVIENVTVIEAYKPTYNHLINNIKLNNIENIQSLNIAIGDKQEDVNFLVTNERLRNNMGGMHVITEFDINFNVRSAELVDKSITCKMYPLDDVNEIDNFDIMLIDIEGMEARFLSGAYNKIMKNKPIIIIEIWNNSKRREEKMLSSREQVINTILSFGYKLLSSIDDDFVFIPNSLVK